MNGQGEPGYRGGPSGDLYIVVNVRPHKIFRREGYNLLLGTAGSHGEVYTQIRRLPAAYRDRVNVETLEASDSLRLTLNVRTSKKEAERLVRILRNTFPKAKIVAAE